MPARCGWYRPRSNAGSTGSFPLAQLQGAPRILSTYNPPSARYTAVDGKKIQEDKSMQIVGGIEAGSDPAILGPNPEQEAKGLDNIIRALLDWRFPGARPSKSLIIKAGCEQEARMLVRARKAASSQAVHA